MAITRNVTVASLMGVLLACGVCMTVLAQDVSERARKIHQRAIVVDLHDDTTQRLISDNFDLGAREARGHIDIPRMREGGLDAIFFSIWTVGTTPGPEGIKQALRQIDAVRAQVRKHPKDLALATTAVEIRRAHAQGKIAALLGLEGGHMLGNDLGVLRMMAALGVRYVTLTHGKNTDWADSSTDDAKHNGLTDFGKEVVLELNRQGVMVDISHVSDKTFYDVLAVTKAPVIASHSSCRALCDMRRNMTDNMIRALAKNGGVIHINYHVGFLRLPEAKVPPDVQAEYKRRSEEIEKKCGDNEACQGLAGQKLNDDMIKEGKLPPVSWERIVDNIDHVVKLVGADHVGLGSDFDGAVMPVGMDDVSKLPKITEALLKRGYSEKDIEKILGGNTLRVMEEVERVSREMQAAK